jgi:hypothetical protein
VNAVSLYVEHGRETFHSVHVEAARRVAAQAVRTGVERLAHVSGIGADSRSPSRYIRKPSEGEVAQQERVIVPASGADKMTSSPGGKGRSSLAGGPIVCHRHRVDHGILSHVKKTAHPGNIP